MANNESSKKLIIIIDSLSTLLLEEKLDEVLRILEQIIVYNENKGRNFDFIWYYASEKCAIIKILIQTIFVIYETNLF